MDERRRFDEQRELLILIDSLKGKWVGHNGQWWILDSMHALNGIRLIQVRDLGNRRYEQTAETFVKPQDLIKENDELIKTYRTAEPKVADAVVAGQPREGELKNVAISQIESSDTPDPEIMEEDVEKQYKIIIEHCEKVISDFVLNNQDKYPKSKEATGLVHRLERILEHTDFYRKDYLSRYFAEHDEIRILRTGKIFSFKTEKGIASFELCVTMRGQFKLNPEKGTLGGVLATTIQNADDSGQNLA